MAKYVQGDQAVRRTLRQLSRSVANAVAEAERFALQPTLKAAKANVSGSDPELAKALTIRKDPAAPKSIPAYQVGPREESPARRRAHLREFGTEAHSLAPGADRRAGRLQEKGPHHPGTAPDPFLTKAYETTAGEVIDRFGQRIGVTMEKQAAKLAKKGGA